MIEKNEISFDEGRFIEGVLNNNYILVVGSGVTLDRELYPDSNGDILHHIINIINEKHNTDFRTISDIAMGMGSKPISDLLVNTLQYKTEDISPELRNLISQKNFRFVITTSPDHYLETLMEGLWGNELRIVNGADDRSLRLFFNALKESTVEGYNQPTLFYIFGKAMKRNSSNFLLTDNDAILYIEKWMKFEGTDPIVPFLKSKRLLGIGCDFDAWYYRFFWYILTRDMISRDKISPQNADNAVIDKDVMDLECYLSNMNVCVHKDSWSVMKYLNHLFTTKLGNTTYKELIEKNKLEGKVFISYKDNPDKKIASQLSARLREHMFNVWYDESSLLGGQAYNKKIPEAIKYTHVFIAILTKGIAEILRQLDSDFILQEAQKEIDSDSIPYYFIKEWLWAREVDDLTIIPVTTDGYDLRGIEHRVFESIIFKNKDDNASGIYIGSEESFEEAGINKLIESIRHGLRL